MISFLLHSANRNIKSEADEVIKAFYEIKDKILKKHGKVIGYDVQHIKGKRCNSCDGHGRHWKYSWTTGKPYDYDDCWHCWSGWYKLPIWVCLHRIEFGGYTFHKPLKRHESVENPFSEEEIGWKVTDSPVIQGYIDHDDHWFGDYAVLILLAIHNWPMFKKLFAEKWYWKKVMFRNWLMPKMNWRGWILCKPEFHWKQYYDEACEHEVDLPF